MTQDRSYPPSSLYDRAIPITTLLIARHGNTFEPGQPVRRVGKRTDLPLAASGRVQARALGAWLTAEGMIPSVIYTSTLQRAKQTAWEAMRASGGAWERCTCWHNVRFDEVDYGEDEGKLESEVQARLGKEVLEAWNRHAIVPPGWAVNPEALRTMWRAFSASDVLGRHPAQTILVVTSAGVARFVDALLGPDAASTLETKLNTGAVSCLRHHPEEGWNVVYWNQRPEVPEKVLLKPSYVES